MCRDRLRPDAVNRVVEAVVSTRPKPRNRALKFCNAGFRSIRARRVTHGRGLRSVKLETVQSKHPFALWLHETPQ